MQRERFEEAHTHELLYRVRRDDGTFSPRKRACLDLDEMYGISARGASKHVSTARFSLKEDVHGTNVQSWLPEALHVHRTVDMGSIRPPYEEEQTVVFEVSEYQTSGDDLHVTFVPQNSVR